MFATKRARILAAAGCVAALAVALVGLGGVALHGLARLEAQPGFCNSCHLPDASPLHRGKLRQARQVPPVDETGAHFQQARVTPFSCATCHAGRGFAGRGAVLWDSFRNTVVYFTGDFREPERIARPIPDATCTACHAAEGFRRDGERFHGIRAHKLPLPVACTACHVAHADGAERVQHLQRVLARLQSTCGNCHDVRPPTPDMLLVLQNVARRRVP